MAVRAPRPTLNQGSGGRAGIRVEGRVPAAAERRLVKGAQRGSAEDFEALFALHWPRAYRTAWLVVHDAAAAEDIAQEAFIAALRALDTFDRRRPFGPWLTRIVINRAIDWARARRLQAVPSESVAPAAPPFQATSRTPTHHLLRSGKPSRGDWPNRSALSPRSISRVK